MSSIWFLLATKKIKTTSSYLKYLVFHLTFFVGFTKICPFFNVTLFFVDSSRVENTTGAAVLLPCAQRARLYTFCFRSVYSFINYFCSFIWFTRLY